jgi:hypothetical protein
MKLSHMFLTVAVVLASFSAGALTVSAQRDYFTDQEIELVRDAQDIDLRIKVLTHAIDRRLAILKIGAESPVHESEKWGPPPTGSRSQLLYDVKRILQKAVDDVDDTAAHAGTKEARTIENPTKKDKSDPPFTRALRELSSAAVRYKPIFQGELAKSTDRKADGPLLDAVDLCDQIIESIGKTNAEPAKK